MLNNINFLATATEVVESVTSKVENTNMPTVDEKLTSATKDGSIFSTLGIDLTSFVFYLICFVIAYLILRSFVFKPLAKYIGERQDQVNSSVDKESDLIKQLASMDEQRKNDRLSLDKEYQKVRENALLDAKNESVNIIVEAQKKSSQIIALANTESVNIKDSVREESEKDALMLFTSIVEKNLSNYRLSPEVQKDIINNLLK